ncbi:MAG: HIT family protein [Acidimicrobiales bacterium]
MEHLWAGWRSAYVGAAGAAEPLQVNGSRGCVFCGILESGALDEDRGIIAEGDTVVVILNAYPYTSGHLMVMPRRHVRELEELTSEEAVEMWSTVHRAVAALKRAYRPDGLNLGLNLGRAAGAGIPGHLHVHAVPRWLGDSNFMTAAASVRVLPESLPDSWRKLRAAWT